MILDARYWMLDYLIIGVSVRSDCHRESSIEYRVSSRKANPITAGPTSDQEPVTSGQ